MFFGGDPFEHFSHMGGGGGGRGAPSGPVDNEGYYNILGVGKDADENEIKKAYKKAALKHHPDKGGDVEKFKEISAAAEVLCDPEKRKVYDQYGKEGLEGQGGEHHSAEDVFSMFFGGGRGGRRGPSGPQKGEDITHNIKVTLADLYNGKLVRLAITRNKLCEECEGRGGKPGAEKSCSDCNGRGAKVQLRQLGPGMVQQIQTVCPTCKGSCKMMDERDKCKSCKGKKVNKDRKVLDVAVEKGMVNGQKIRFSGEADEAPNTVPGDVVFIVDEKPSDEFKRKGADLIHSIDLTLSESLCGFTRTITHMDGRVLRIESRPGEVVKPDDVRMIQGEGMPHHGNPFTKGRLFIHFRVTFPTTMAPGAVNALKAVLPKAKELTLTGEEEECNMTPADVSQFGQGDGRRMETTDEDDEDGRGGGQRVQCQNM
jgi:DnaJ family protein A protein 2